MGHLAVEGDVCAGAQRGGLRRQRRLKRARANDVQVYLRMLVCHNRQRVQQGCLVLDGGEGGNVKGMKRGIGRRFGRGQCVKRDA